MLPAAVVRRLGPGVVSSMLVGLEVQESAHLDRLEENPGHGGRHGRAISEPSPTNPSA